MSHFEIYLWLASAILVIFTMLAGLAGAVSAVLLNTMIGVVWLIVDLLNAATWTG